MYYHEDLTSLFCRDNSTTPDEGVHSQENDNMVQQLSQELSLRGMFFSKNCIQLSKVVGQGRLHLTQTNLILHILLCRRVRIGVLCLP